MFIDLRFYHGFLFFILHYFQFKRPTQRRTRRKALLEPELEPVIEEGNEEEEEEETSNPVAMAVADAPLITGGKKSQRKRKAAKTTAASEVKASGEVVAHEESLDQSKTVKGNEDTVVQEDAQPSEVLEKTGPPQKRAGKRTRKQLQNKTNEIEGKQKTSIEDILCIYDMDSEYSSCCLPPKNAVVAFYILFNGYQYGGLD